MLLPTDSLFFLILSIILAFCYHIFQKRKRLPPGPRGYPYFGIYHIIKERPHEKLAYLAQKYGDVFSFTLFGQTYIHLNSLEVIKEAFTLKAKYFNGRENIFSLVNFWDDGGGISQVEGNVWKEDRRFFLQNVKSFGFGKTDIEPHIHKVTKSLLSILNDTEGNPTSVIVPLCFATINCSGKVFMNLEYDVTDSEFIHLTKCAYSLMQEFGSVRMLAAGYIYKYILFRCISPNYQKLKITKETFYNITDKIIEEHKLSFDKNHMRDFTDKMLEKMFEEQKSHQKPYNPMTHEKIRSLIVNIFVDGMLSTTNALKNFLQRLALNEDVQIKIQKEIDEIIGANRLPSWNDRYNLPYTEAALSELHRTGTTFPLSVVHRCSETGELNGYTIPKNSLVVSNLWSVHNNPKQWKNPDICDPNRFLSCNGEEKKMKESIVNFGVGKRNCVGEPLATMEIFIFITSILQAFNIRLPKGANKESLEKELEFDICFIPRAT